MECVGSVDSGLTSMSWSPDEELVVLTTGPYVAHLFILVGDEEVVIVQFRLFCVCCTRPIASLGFCRPPSLVVLV